MILQQQPHGGAICLNQKGDPVSPNVGRPKGRKSLSTIIREYLDSPASPETMEALNERGISKAQALVLQQMKKACEKGELPSAQWLAERGEGKPKEVEDESESKEIPIKLTPQQLASLSNELIKIKESLKQPEQKKAEVIEVEPINPCKFE